MTVAAFEVGQSYSMTSACDHECVWTYTIARRTAKTIKTTCGKTLRLSVYNGVETCKPLGSYSMAPVLGADRKA